MPSIPLEHQDLTIADLVEQEGRALVVAVNKWDLVADKQKTLKELRDTLDVSAGAAAWRAAGDAVGACRAGACDKLEEAVFASYERWNRRVPTPALNRWLGEALERHTRRRPGDGASRSAS